MVAFGFGGHNGKGRGVLGAKYTEVEVFAGLGWARGGWGVR